MANILQVILAGAYKQIDTRENSQLKETLASIRMGKRGREKEWKAQFDNYA